VLLALINDRNISDDYETTRARVDYMDSAARVMGFMPEASLNGIGDGADFLNAVAQHAVAIADGAGVEALATFTHHALQAIGYGDGTAAGFGKILDAMTANVGASNLGIRALATMGADILTNGVDRGMSYGVQKQWSTRLAAAIGTQIKNTPTESIGSETMRAMEGFAGSVIDSGSREVLKSFGEAMAAQSTDFLGRSVVSTGEGNVGLTAALLSHYQERRKTASTPEAVAALRAEMTAKLPVVQEYLGAIQEMAGTPAVERLMARDWNELGRIVTANTNTLPGELRSQLFSPVSPKIDRAVEKTKMMLSLASFSAGSHFGFLAGAATSAIAQFGWSALKAGLQIVRPLSEEDAAVAGVLKSLQSKAEPNAILKMVGKWSGNAPSAMTLGLLKEAALSAAKGNEAKATQIAQGVLGVLSVANPSVQDHLDTVLSLNPATPLIAIIDSGRVWTTDSLNQEFGLKATADTEATNSQETVETGADVAALQTAEAQNQRDSGQTDVQEPTVDLTNMTLSDLRKRLADLRNEVERVYHNGGSYGPVWQKFTDTTNEINRRIQERERNKANDKTLDAKVQREIGAFLMKYADLSNTINEAMERQESREEILSAINNLDSLLGTLSPAAEQALPRKEEGENRRSVNKARSKTVNAPIERELTRQPMPVDVPAAVETGNEMSSVPGAAPRATLSEVGQLWMGVGSFGVGRRGGARHGSRGGDPVGGAVVAVGLAGLTSSAYFLGQWGRERSLDRAQGAGVTAWVEDGQVRVAWERFAGLMGSNWMGWLNPIGAWNRDVMALGVIRHELAHRDLGAGEFGAALAQVMPTFVSFAYGTVRALSNVAAGRSWNEGLASLTGGSAEGMLAEMRSRGAAAKEAAAAVRAVEGLSLGDHGLALVRDGVRTAVEVLSTTAGGGVGRGVGHASADDPHPPAY
jgi:hypothetical protein